MGHCCAWHVRVHSSLIDFLYNDIKNLVFPQGYQFQAGFGISTRYTSNNAFKQFPWYTSFSTNVFKQSPWYASFSNNTPKQYHYIQPQYPYQTHSCYEQTCGVLLPISFCNSASLSLLQTILSLHCPHDLATSHVHTI